MHLKRAFVTLSLILFLPSVCFSEVEKKYYENGNIKEEITFKNGKREGPAKIYYENGALQIQGTYKNGKPEGTYAFRRQSQISEYIESFRACGDSNISHKIYDEGLAHIFSSTNLNLECLKGKYDVQHKLLNRKRFTYTENPNGERVEVIEDVKTEIIETSPNNLEITSLHGESCGEYCNPTIDTILLDGNRYWYIFSEFGIEVKILKSKPSGEPRVALISHFLSTHKKNHIFKLSTSEIVPLMDGDVTTVEYDYYIVSGKKILFKGGQSLLD